MSRRWFDETVSDQPSNPQPLPIHLAICLDTTALDRFQPVIRHLVVGMIDAPIHIRLICEDPRVEKLQFGPTQAITHMPLTWPFVSARIESLLADIHQTPPTIVHAVDSGSYRKAWFIADEFDIDMVASVTSFQDIKLLRDFDLSRVQAFVAWSQPLVNELRSNVRIKDARVDLIRPGIKAVDSRKLTIGSGQVPSLLCTTPLTRNAGLESLIRALDLLRSSHPETMLFMLGKGKTEPKLRRVVADLQLSSHVTFANPLGDAADAMGSADIFVSTVPAGELDVDCLRAMGAGMAVVATENPANDFCRNNETALVCRHNNAQDLASAIDRLLSDHAFASKLAAAGTSYVKEHHSMTGMADATVQTYRDIALSRATFPMKE